jgi:hypothetical protein
MGVPPGTYAGQGAERRALGQEGPGSYKGAQT